MFTTIIVPLDSESGGDRVRPIVRALSALADVAVELLSITPTTSSLAVDTTERCARAAAGWPPHTCRFVTADDVPRAIADEVNGRPDTLLVMATSAKRPLLGHLLGSVSEAVLRQVERPVLLVGPHVPATIDWRRPTPILCLDPGTAAADAVAAITGWAETFPIARPWIAEVVPMAGFGGAGPDADGSAHIECVMALLADAGVVARAQVMHGGLPEIRLDDFADQVVQPVFVTVSSRWTAGRHWHSTTRQLVQRSTRPVLVAPARLLPGLDDPSAAHDVGVVTATKP